MSAHIEDARGLLCPLPVIRLEAACSRVEVGEVVELWADDPAADDDVQMWCRGHGHEWLGSEEQASHTQIRVKKCR